MQFWYHTRHIPKLGFLEHIIVTPSIHRVHHAINPEYIDKNMSQIFIIWDKIFGTYQPVIPGMKPDYGVLKGPDSYNPFWANMHEFSAIWHDVKNATGWKNKLKHIFYPPGWSYDQSTKTARQLQAALRKERNREAA